MLPPALRLASNTSLAGIGGSAVNTSGAIERSCAAEEDDSTAAAEEGA